jgi:F-type H+-transporting ATPase subunit b
MEPLIATFHIDWKIIIAQMVNFGLVFLVLYLYALKPLSKLMAERSERITKGLTDAKENSTILEKSKKEYEEALTKARKEAQVLFEAGKKEAQSKKEQMLAETKVEVDKMIEGGKKILEAEKVKMLMEAKKELVDLVMLATEKVTGTKDANLQEKALKEINSLTK